MYCRNCGKELDANAAVCTGCGVAKGTGTSFCQNCGKPTQAGQAICTSCGFSLDNASASKKASNKQAHRSSDGKIITGVCSGLGETYNITPWLFRLLFILFGATFLGIVVYIILSVALPLDP